MPVDMIVLAQHVFDVTNDAFRNTENVLKGVTAAAGTVAIVWVYAKKQALAPVIATICAAAFALWMVNNVPFLESSAETTVRILND